MSRSTRSLWPVAIVTWFALFIAFLAAFIIFAALRHDDLVRRDYYEEEVRYQRQLDRANRGQAVSREVAVRYDAVNQRITISLPPAQAALHPSGSINFYRPSDASLDHARPLVTDAGGVQHVNASHLRPGLWKVHLYWTVNDQEFYFDQAIVVQPRESAADSSRSAWNSSAISNRAPVQPGLQVKFEFVSSSSRCPS